MKKCFKCGNGLDERQGRFSVDKRLCKKEGKKMDIKEFDKVLLKDGRTGHIVEILGKGEAYLVDVDI